MNDMSMETEKKEKNIFSKTIKKVFNIDDSELTAESAWLSSTYGAGGNLPTEKRIANKQRDITNLIKSKFSQATGTADYHATYSSYRCVIDIEEDLVAYTDVILKPFVDNGFKVINLSECIDEVGDENVYLISWKNVFSSTHKEA